MSQNSLQTTSENLKLLRQRQVSQFFFEAFRSHLCTLTNLAVKQSSLKIAKCSNLLLVEGEFHIEDAKLRSCNTILNSLKTWITKNTEKLPNMLLRILVF